MGITVGIGSAHFSISAFGRHSAEQGAMVLHAAVVRDRPASRASAPSPDPEVRPLPDGFDGATDPGGPQEVLYGARRGVVRVAGRDHPLPTADATLVLLVHDDGTAEPVVRTRLLTPAVRFDDAARSPTGGLFARLFGKPLRDIPWLAALMEDPELAAMLDPPRRRAS